MAACTLHNKMRNVAVEGDIEDPVTHDIHEGAWRNDPPLGEPLQAVPGNSSTYAAKDQRETLRDYFSSPEGAVSWQDDKV